MTEHDDDLPQGLARLMRDVPPADEATRNAHIAAALSQAPVSARQRHSDPGRRILLAAAAAVIAVLGAGAGWAARGQQGEPMADVSAMTRAADAEANVQPAVATTVPGKGTSGTGVSPTTAPPCTASVSPDATYLGEYADKRDGTAYLLFREKESLVFVDRSTCAQVWLSAVTTVP